MDNNLADITSRFEKIMKTSTPPHQCVEALRELLAQASNYADATGLELVARIRDALGRKLLGIGNGRAALLILQESVQNLSDNLANCSGPEQVKLKLVLIGALQNLCFAETELGDFNKAETAGRKAVELAQEYFPDLPVYGAIAMFSLSTPYYRSRQYEKALALAARAKEIFEAAGNMEKAATCMNNMGRICEEQGRIAEGIAWHEKAVGARRELSNREDLAFSLGNLGVAYAQTEQWRQAEAALTEAVMIYGELGLAASRECNGYVRDLQICRQALAAFTDDPLNPAK